MAPARSLHISCRVLALALALLIALSPGLGLADPDPDPQPAAAEATSAEATEAEPAEDFDDFDEELEAAPAGFPDPLEGTNRGVLGFNGVIDRWILDPITKAYGFLVPNLVKRSIRRVFVNLGEPGTTVNNLLQLEWGDAGISLSRFVINTTAGIGGLFDPASALGLEYHRSDFGQTLALAGTPSGAYLMVPVAGPNNVRDGFGVLADFTMHPLTWFLGPTNFLLFGIYGGGQGLSTREEHIEQLDALREGSIDYYAALRNAYYQNRIAAMWERREHRRDDWGVD
jgi:phospholipid-binding lipoprotein MlaA